MNQTNPAPAANPESSGKKPLTPAERRKRGIRNRRIFRAAIQLFFFLAMPGTFAAGWNGAKSIFQSVGEGAPISANTFLCALIGLCAFTILFGRWFCGFACAFGSIGDFVYWISRTVQTKIFRRKKPSSCPARLRGVLQWIKYGVLAALLLLCALGLYGKLGGFSPWDVFSRLAALKPVPAGYAVGAILLALILGGMAWQERFFCQFLCPMGALFALLPHMPFGSLRRNEANCLKNCDLCRSGCPVGVKLEEDGIRNGECVGCEACVGVCPRANIGRMEKKLLRREIVGALIRAVLFFCMGAAFGLCRFF